jgi:transcriptional regulator with GAF, ATPase, and Fis domain
VERGAFRRDLFARLSRLEIRVPPLRERRADLLAWIARLGQAWRELRPGVETGVLDFDAEAAESLLLGEWPDNLRGVERLVHHFSLDIARPRPLGRADLPPWVTAATLATSARPPGAPAATAAQVRLSAPLASAPPRQSPSSPPSPASSPSPASARLPAPTREELVAVLQRTGSVRATAKHFGRDRRQIYRWIEAMRIDLDPPSRS